MQLCVSGVDGNPCSHWFDFEAELEEHSATGIPVFRLSMHLHGVELLKSGIFFFTVEWPIPHSLLRGSK